MYCRNCGQMVNATDARCSKCGVPTKQTIISPSTSSYYEPVANYLVQSILVTLFCCMPFGVVAIVFAATAQTKAQTGDIKGAMLASQSARKWCWVSFGLGLLPGLIWLIWIFILIAGGVMGEF